MLKRLKARRRWCYALVAVGLAGGLGLNLLAYRHAYAMTHFTDVAGRTGKPETMSWGQRIQVLFNGVRIERPHSSLAPSQLGPQCRRLSIPGTNGIRLGGWYCPGAPQSPLVLLFHGYTGEKTGTLPAAQAFLELGYGVLLVDFRGSGESSESYTTVGFDEAEDVAAAALFARQNLGQTRLILYGQSMGAAGALRAVHSCGVRPEAIIAESVFDRMLSTVQHRFELMGVPAFPSAQLLVFWGGRQMGFNGFAHNPVAYAARVPCPILFLHGADDPRARLAEARMVYDAVPTVKRFHSFPGVRHQSPLLRFPAEWKEAVRTFLTESHLEPPGAARD